ncbi:hypothetical protein L6164_016578 [Bauhinia variegata]|uniref:Uncharacterized protein n=1 Tax=Bauhinia variegata TaxID=167791 RepID=A0ACB9NP41_BAUVA|nr:hypothetical protein L6164_016578 [Bauhinia variegata]
MKQCHFGNSLVITRVNLKKDSGVSRHVTRSLSACKLSFKSVGFACSVLELQAEEATLHLRSETSTASYSLSGLTTKTLPRRKITQTSDSEINIRLSFC